MSRHLTFIAALCVALTGCGSDSSDTIIVDDTEQVDRMGFAVVNTVFIGSANKDNYNQGSPATDGQFTTEITNSINGLRANVNGRAGFPAEDGAVAVSVVVGAVNPDTVTISFASSATFPNGRALDDDVIDTALQLTLDRSFVTDDIDTNDATFSSTFPYLAPEN